LYLRGQKIFALFAMIQLLRDYARFSDKLKAGALWAAQNFKEKFSNG